MYKSELAAKYKMSVRALARLLNERYYEELAKLDYRKSVQFVEPIVVRRFVELWGKPLTDNDL